MLIFFKELYALASSAGLDNVAAVTISIAMAVAANHALKKTAIRARLGNRHRNRGYGLKEMDLLSPREFQRMFRMSRYSFDNLLHQLHDDWGDSFGSDVHVMQAQRSSGDLLCMKTRLACALRWMAGGSYLDICFEFGVGQGSFYADSGVLWGNLEAIDRLFEIGVPFSDTARHRVFSLLWGPFEKLRYGHRRLGLSHEMPQCWRSRISHGV
jgi:hypothetical protein